MPSSWLLRFGAVCGVILGLSTGVPGLVEAFIGETAVTSFVIGLGAAFGAPALTAFHMHQSGAAGRFGAVAYGVNLLGLGLFAGVAFSLNLVLFFLDGVAVAGATRIALFGGVAVFVAGTVLFCAAMVRARVFPRVPVWGYGLSLTALALLAPLPDSVVTSGVHVVACVSLVWLSLAVWSGSGRSVDQGAYRP